MGDHYNVSLVEEALNQVTSNTKTCPYCGGQEFTVLPELGTLNKTEYWGQFHLDNILTLSMLECNNCGHVALFHAKQIQYK